MKLIADILSFQNNDAILKQTFTTTEVDWEGLVKIASEHLVLTTVYCRLKDKSLLDEIPEDLNTYLEALTTINRNRNKTLLSEAQAVSKLLNANNINHVFIKGIALIAGNYYNDIGERMVGDMDILVDSQHLNTAFELLSEHGYNKHIAFNYTQKNYRHLPRQVNENRLAAIELHNAILRHEYKELIDKKQVLQSQIVCNSIAIPDTHFLNLINVLTVQINDHASYFKLLKFKNAYDSMVLGLERDNELIKHLLTLKHGKYYLTFFNALFPGILSQTSDLKNSVLMNYFLWKLKHPKIAYIIFSVKSVSINTLERFRLLFSNSSYRRQILKNKRFQKSKR